MPRRPARDLERVATDVVADDLVDVYRRGATRLSQAIELGLRRGLDASTYGTPDQRRGDATQAYRERQRRAALAVIAEVESTGAAVVPAATRRAYASSIIAVDRTLLRRGGAGGSVGLEGRFGGLHERAIAVLAGNAQASLERAAAQARASVATVFDRAAALDGALDPRAALGNTGGAGRALGAGFIGRRADDAWRKLALDAIGEGTVALETRRQITRELIERLIRDGVTDATTGYVDRAGRRWALDTYAEMVVRTTTREATSRATVNRLTENGLDLVTISSHVHAADECSPYDGGTFSLSGTSSEFPRLDKLPPFHPRCRHVVTPAGTNLDEFERELGLAAEETKATPATPPAPDAPTPPPTGTPREELARLVEQEKAATAARRPTAGSGPDFDAAVDAKARELYGDDYRTTAGDPLNLRDWLLDSRIKVLEERGYLDADGVRRLKINARVSLLRERGIELPGDPFDLPPSPAVRAAYRELEETFDGFPEFLDAIGTKVNGLLDELVKLPPRAGIPDDAALLAAARREVAELLGGEDKLAAVIAAETDPRRLAAIEEQIQRNYRALKERAEQRARELLGPELDETSITALGDYALRHVDKRVAELLNDASADELAAAAADVTRTLAKANAARARYYDIAFAPGARRGDKAVRLAKKAANDAKREYAAALARQRALSSPGGPRYAEAVRTALGELRDGFGEGTVNIGRQRSNAADLIAEAGRYLPREWTDDLAAYDVRRGGPVTVKFRRGARAYFQELADEIVLGDDLDPSTALHELGHRIERAHPHIRGLERAWWERRTAGETSRWLGSGYGRHEVARRDKFTKAYIGKDYGGRAWEVLTMGLQGVFYRDHGIDSDADMRRFILGLLVAG